MEAAHTKQSTSGQIPKSRSPSVEVGHRSTKHARDLEQLLSRHPSSLDGLKAHLLSGLTAARRLPLVNLSEPYQKVHQLLSQTVLAGEGNSMLIVGPRGTGKTLLVETAIDDLSRAHREDFYVVRLNGLVHTDDKLASKEVWRQLGREMNVEDDITSGKSNYADTLTLLLALLSHEEEGEESGPEQSRTTAKSVIFILDEVDLFASHPRQTLLYNLFDLAQSSPTPLAVLGLTTKVDAVEMLEKRVKSRFGQRYVHLSAPRTYEAFQEICQEGLLFRRSLPPSTPSGSASLSDTPHPGKEAAHAPDAEHMQRLREAWNTYISHHLLAHPILQHHLRSIYATSKTPSTFYTSALLPLLLASPLPTPESFLASNSLSLHPPDSNLHSLLPTLSTLALSLLICAARLEVILSTPLCSFDMAYEEYVSLASKTRLRASAAGQLAATQRVWGKAVAKDEWERLSDVRLMVPVGGAATTTTTYANSEHRASGSA
ncbi:MAG: hypothetical protein Q9163_006535 [Psora crenata]